MHQLGLSSTTGAFAAGVLLASSQYRQQIEADIKPFEGILLGIFFMTAGANLDPGLCIREWPTLLSGILAFLAAKVRPTGWEGSNSGQRARALVARTQASARMLLWLERRPARACSCGSNSGQRAHALADPRLCAAVCVLPACRSSDSSSPLVPSHSA